MTTLYNLLFENGRETEEKLMKTEQKKKNETKKKINEEVIALKT